MYLYSEISFVLGRPGRSGPQAVLARLVGVFRTFSWPDPGPKPFPFIFILAAGQPAPAMAKALLWLPSIQNPDPKPFSVPVFYF